MRCPRAIHLRPTIKRDFIYWSRMDGTAIFIEIISPLEHFLSELDDDECEKSISMDYRDAKDMSRVHSNILEAAEVEIHSAKRKICLFSQLDAIAAAEHSLNLHESSSSSTLKLMIDFGEASPKSSENENREMKSFSGSRHKRN